MTNPQMNGEKSLLRNPLLHIVAMIKLQRVSFHLLATPQRKK